MNCFVQPKPISCDACGTADVRPRIITNTLGNEVITEAKWICHRCGNMFKSGIISRESKQVIHKK